MNDLKWEEFERVDLRVGTIINARIFEKAIKPALKLEIDFGASIGVKKSSAQITDHYDPSDIIGKQVCAVINFPRKQIDSLVQESSLKTHGLFPRETVFVHLRDN